MNRLLGSALHFALATLVGGSAFAVRPPTHFGEIKTSGLEAADGTVRIERSTRWTVPLAARSSWHQFQEVEEGSWRALWDAQTKVPLRVYGTGIAVPNANRDETTAAIAAKDFLRRHLALFAPGASIGDFKAVSNHWDELQQMRTVGFVQIYRGLDVLGGQISFRFKNNRLFVVGSTALPHVEATLPAKIISAADAGSVATHWLQTDLGVPSHLRARVSGPVILPLISENGTIRYEVVLEAIVETHAPVSRWSVYIDAQSATPIARRQTLRFADGTLQYNAPERHPAAQRIDYPAPFVRLTVDGAQSTSDADGIITWTSSASATVRVTAEGDQVRVLNDAGPEITETFTLDPNGTVTLDVQDEEFDDAQIASYMAGSIAKERALRSVPANRWLTRERLQITVNINDSCNAYSDGTTINFMRSSSMCQNTGRLMDVIYHEFGHSLHAHLIIGGAGSFDEALSEGGADFFSATINNDPAMGRGFFHNNQPLRHLDDHDAVWPDDIAGDSHETGLIFGGAMWDLRKEMVLEYGDDGVARSELLLMAAFQRAEDIPSSYPEILAADDDDGNLENGTPNLCMINDAFAKHGLADPEVLRPPFQKPTIDNFRVTLPLETRNINCPGSGIVSVELKHKNRAESGPSTPLTMNEVANGYEADIPALDPGSVLLYQVVVTLESGELVQFPQNPAAPMYEVFVGPVTEIYCTDFEIDPDTDGWTHELLSGEARQGADDWQWGEPAGTEGSGDPATAFSGVKVYGNDLGGGNYNGKYQNNKKNALVSPIIETHDFQNVRLQYRRWLNVEDGFFDQADIMVNRQVLWTNLATGDGGSTHHEDREWRFQDVDLSDVVEDGHVQVGFTLASDGGLEFGGWTIDDFCIVAFVEPRCGDGNVDPGETCDDGNTEDGDGCEADCTPTPPPNCGNGTIDSGEACDDGNTDNDDACRNDCTLNSTAPDCSVTPDDPACQTTSGGNLESDDSGGCGCSTTNESKGTLLLLALAGLLFIRRR